jgi:FAD synthase
MTEVNIFDFDENIYGKEMRVYVRNFMRREIKFESLDELVIQLTKDEVSARKQLAS